MNGEEIVINSKLTAEDYKKAAYFGVFGKNAAVKWLIAVAIPVAILQILYVAMAGQILYPLAFYTSLMGMGVLLFAYIVVGKESDRFVKQNKVQTDSIRTIYFEKDGISSLQPNLERVKYPYELFREAYETKTLFLIYTPDAKAVIIAKRDIDDKTAEKMRETLKQHMKLKIRA